MKKLFLFILPVVMLSFLCADTSGENIGPPVPPKRSDKRTDERTERQTKLDLDIAEYYVRQQRFAEAVEVLAKVFKAKGPLVKLLHIAGMIVQFSGTTKYHDTILEFFRAGEKGGFKGWNPELYMVYGTIYVQLDRFEDFRLLIKRLALKARGDVQLANDLRGVFVDSLSAYFSHLGMPFVGGDRFIQRIWNDWDKEAKEFLEEGTLLENHQLYPDAMIAFRRAALLSEDNYAAYRGMARCWIACGDFDKAKAFSDKLGDGEVADGIRKAIEERKPLGGGLHENLHPDRTGLVCGLMPQPEMHAVQISDKYIAGITSTMDMLVLDKATLKPVLYDFQRDRHTKDIEPDKAPSRLFFYSVKIDGDLVGACYIDAISQGKKGVIEVFALPNPEPVVSIEMHLSEKYFDSIYMTGGYIFALQRKGTRPWFSVYEARTGKLLWRKSGFDEVIFPPVLDGDDILVGFSSLGMGALYRMAVKDGSKKWTYNYNYAVMTERAKPLIGYRDKSFEGVGVPISGVYEGGFAWLPERKGENETDLVAVNPMTGNPDRRFTTPLRIAGGLVRSGGRSLFLDDSNAVACLSEKGEVLWRMESSIMYFKPTLEGEIGIFQEVDGVRVVNLSDGTTKFFDKGLMDCVLDNGTIYSPKMIIDLKRDLDNVNAYIDKLADYAVSISQGFNYEEEGKKIGFSVSSPGEKLLLERKVHQPGISRIFLHLARLTKNQYFSNVKEYFNDYVTAEMFNAKKMKAVFKEFVPEMEFLWIGNCNSFVGAWDERGYVKTRVNAGEIVYSDMTNKPLWSRQTAEKQQHNHFLSPEGVLYFFPGDSNALGEMFYLSRETGKELWRAKHSWCLKTRQIEYRDGRLYFFTKWEYTRGRFKLAVCCLDEKTGSLLWQFNPTGIPSPGISSHHIMAFDDEALYFGSTDAAVYKLKLTDGSVIWRTPSVGAQKTGRTDGYFGTVALSNGKVLTHSSDDLIYCLDAKDGRILWTSKIPQYILDMPKVKGGKRDDTYWVADPVAITDKLFMAVLEYNRQRSILAYDIETGDFKWEFKRTLVHFSSMFASKEEGVLYLPVFSSGFEKISLMDGSLLAHYPVQVQTGYKKGNLIMFDLSGYLLLAKLRERKQ